jgi:two-component system cell cycle sensor histidine kinase/response regulator CckA
LIFSFFRFVKYIIAKIFNVRPGEIIGRSLNEFLDPDQKEVLDGHTVGKRKKGRETYELEIRRLDADRGSVLVTSTPRFDESGKFIGTFNVFRDITDQRQALAALQTSEEQFRLISENVADLITLLDTDGKRLYNSPSYRDVLGDPHELLGTDFFEGIHPEDKEGVQRIFRESVASGKSYRVEYRTFSKEGEIRFIESQGSVIKDKYGKTSRVVAVSRDTTEKKKIDAHLLRAQRMDSLGTLAGGIAHDLNNVLTPILLAAEILDKRFTQPQSKQLVSSIRLSALRGSDIVKQVLTFARGTEQEFSPQQPRYIIREIESIIKETFPRSIELRSNVAKDLKTVFADPTRLHQVLMNLCVNARDAMPRGGRLSIAASNVVIDDTFASMQLGGHAGEYVLLGVTDTGVGIPREIQDKIFEPFFTTKEIGKGTGLGLSTVFAIVKDHKGFIRFTSEVGKGSEFNIYLPAIQQEYAVSQQIPEKNIPTGNGERILVVDDELSVLQITKETLEIHNFQVLTSTDGADAVAIFADAKKGSIQLVITDLNMPVMDGIATVHALRRIDPKIKIIISSGLLTGTDPVKLAMLNIQGSLTKPYNAEKLITTAYNVLNEKRAT